MVKSIKKIDGEQWSYTLATPDKVEAKNRARNIREIEWRRCRVTKESDNKYYVWIPLNNPSR